MLPTMGFDDAEGRIPGVQRYALVCCATSSVASAPVIPWRVASPRCPLVFGRKVFFCLCPAVSTLGFLIGENGRLLGFVAGVVTPVGLHEHGVDLFEINCFGAVAHGFD